MKTILLTGGLGFIGTHCVVELVNVGYHIVIFDNISMSKESTLQKLYRLCNKNYIDFYKGDICSYSNLEHVFKKYNIYGVIHLAALKSVKESIKNPLLYFENNISGTLQLLKVMKQYKTKHFIFSSSATVYGTSKSPLTEISQTGKGITNPYGYSKYTIEELLKQLSKTKPYTITILRYFNPIGSHSSGLIGEDPQGIPTNIMPILCRKAFTKKIFTIFGNDYDTKDGTCIRDYIHVVDLAKAHVCALKKMEQCDKVSFNIYNIGTGKGTSVKELVTLFSQVNQLDIQVKYLERRSGDVDITYCNTTKAKQELGFIPMYNVKDMCRDSWTFYKKNMFFKNNF